MKKTLFLFIFLFSCGLLSGCGSVNYAPGKAYINAEPGFAAQDSE
ncbi:MAG: hypothetical protein NTZ67_01830 [Gammaproteobacteria bacterium]|nr:hypothetical protein [Gammaproteobacteria bacterium]